jgi:GNAT superfamily N-acetyltransferase
MTTPSNPVLPLGYSSVAPGQLANAVTCLEMTERPATQPGTELPAPFKLAQLGGLDLAGYRSLYRRVGEPWLWSSRLAMPDRELLAILGDKHVQAYALCEGPERVGLLELDFRVAGECELAFFGIVPGQIGLGLGRSLMDATVSLAWARPITRFWVHTCSFDHPRALEFYIRSGFRPFAFQVEVLEDPRLTGHLPRSAAPHVPLLQGAVESASDLSARGLA